MRPLRGRGGFVWVLPHDTQERRCVMGINSVLTGAFCVRCALFFICAEKPQCFEKQHVTWLLETHVAFRGR